jgi:sugar phosphate isomerase/epimerase
LNYGNSDDRYIEKLSETAKRRGISIEVGMRGVSRENIQRHIRIAQILRARLIRIVLGEVSETLPKDFQRLKNEALISIESVLPLLEEAGLCLGIENHFDFAAGELVDIVSQINSKQVGLIFDSTNCLGLVEKPLDVLCMMKEHLLSVHLKDYEVRKTDGGYVFCGVDLGEGSLNIEAVIQTARSFNPHASFIVEYNMKPSVTVTENELLDWESDCARRNVSAILAFASHRAPQK